MGGALEAKFRGLENGIDMRLPQAARFRVTLKGMENRKDHGAVDGFAKLGLVPIRIGIVNRDKSRNLILSITTINFVTNMGSKGKEKTLDRLFNTGGVGRGNLV